MAKHKFRFNLQNVDWCKWIACLGIIVVVILSIVILTKVDKKHEGFSYCGQGSGYGPLPTTGWESISCPGVAGKCYANGKNFLVINADGGGSLVGVGWSNRYPDTSKLQVVAAVQTNPALNDVIAYWNKNCCYYSAGQPC